ncbi:hypothetical protein ACM6Q7_03095 [Peribacillus butanolivorans]
MIEKEVWLHLFYGSFLFVGCVKSVAENNRIIGDFIDLEISIISSDNHNCSTNS